jgi:hypothetical protein
LIDRICFSKSFWQPTGQGRVKIKESHPILSLSQVLVKPEEEDCPPNIKISSNGKVLPGIYELSFSFKLPKEMECREHKNDRKHSLQPSCWFWSGTWSGKLEEHGVRYWVEVNLNF